MRDDVDTAPRGGQARRWSLALDLIAIACSIAPVVGDVASIPVAVAAIVTRLAGTGRHEPRDGRTARRSAFGVGRGAVDLLLAVVLVLASKGPG